MLTVQRGDEIITKEMWEADPGPKHQAAFGGGWFGTPRVEVSQKSCACSVHLFPKLSRGRRRGRPRRALPLRGLQCGHWGRSDPARTPCSSTVLQLLHDGVLPLLLLSILFVRIR